MFSVEGMNADDTSEYQTGDDEDNSSDMSNYTPQSTNTSSA